MYTYRIALTRCKNHHRRQSAPIFAQAETFYKACELADRIIQGNQWADPESKFEITSICTDGLSGLQCSDGGEVPSEVDKGPAL